ncbi:hypothetical protein Q669_21565 [Labrenzia sp. C1B10]|nr:hypothetical protein Q669_21565 [Labrenzia sp. C1B10]ERS01589.1 hypothetical protein Q675_05680 [Labrenzia sp. C1B70]
MTGAFVSVLTIVGGPKTIRQSMPFALKRINIVQKVADIR